MYKYLCSILLLIVLTANAQFKWNSPFGSGGGTGGLTSNQVYQIALLVGGATNGQTGAQVTNIVQVLAILNRAGIGTNATIYQLTVNSNLFLGADGVITYDTSPDKLIISNVFYQTAIALSTNLVIPGIDVFGEAYFNQNLFAYSNLFVQGRFYIDQGIITGTGAHLGVVDNGDGNYKVVLTNDNNSGGGNLATNANQFGANTTLTIITAAMLTNLNHFGNFTNRGETYLVGIPTNLTVVSVIGKDSSGRLFDYPVPTGSGGSATNAIALLNGFGTNTTIYALVVDQKINMTSTTNWITGNEQLVLRGTNGVLLNPLTGIVYIQGNWFSEGRGTNGGDFYGQGTATITSNLTAGINGQLSTIKGRLAVSNIVAEGLSGFNIYMDSAYLQIRTTNALDIVNGGLMTISGNTKTSGRGTNVGDWYGQGNATITSNVTASSFTTPSTSTANGIVVLNNTNGTGAVSLTTQSNAVGVHEFRFDFKDFAPNQIIVAHATNKFGTTNIVTLTNVANAASVNIATNANQFGPQVTLTLRGGILVTNVGAYGPNTNYDSFYMKGTVDTNLTAVSILGRDSTGKIFEYPVPSGSGNLATNANQFGPQVTLTIKIAPMLTNLNVFGDSTNRLGDWYSLGSTFTTSNSTAASFNATGGGTNSFGATSITNLAGVPLVIKGPGGSNGAVAGLIYSSMLLYTNLGTAPATLTNMGNVVIAGHTLTNTGDAIRFEADIAMPSATVNTNQFKLVFGSTTLMDTGLIPASNGPVHITGKITRTGNTAQHFRGALSFTTPGQGSLVSTNVNIELAETNGINTTFALQGASRRAGGATNNAFFVWYEPNTY